MSRSFKIWCVLLFIALFFEGCIHEYPHPTGGRVPGKGETEGNIDAYIEVTFSLSWESMIQNIDFSPATKARGDNPYRFVMEVWNQEGLVCHDVAYISEEDFKLGYMRHRLTTPLSPESYDICVWMDYADENNDYPFDANNLRKVVMLNKSTTDVEALKCAYAKDNLDLAGYDNTQGSTAVKTLTLGHPGGRFELVATDVKEFITDKKEALNNGDYFSAVIDFQDGGNYSYNLFEENVEFVGEQLSLSGRMRFPFAEYDKLKIAEGFIFCNEEENVSIVLRILNSALVTVSRTSAFSFPVKRGYITVVEGDFLTNPIDGIFSVNNIWDGEIMLEI